MQLVVERDNLTYKKNMKMKQESCYKWGYVEHFQWEVIEDLYE